MMLRVVLVAIGLACATAAAFAQTAQGNVGGAAASTAAAMTTMKVLLSQGYEIKTAVPNGAKFVVFMQKDQTAYACEFVTLTDTKCGPIN